MSLISLTKDNFEVAVLNASIPVVVDFWSETCAPCKAIATILDRVSDLNEDSFLVAKLNVDEYPAIAQRYAVRGAPTLKVFVKGEVVATRVGAAPKSIVQSWIAASLEPLGISVA